MESVKLSRTAFYNGQWANKRAPRGGWQLDAYNSAYLSWRIGRHSWGAFAGENLDYLHDAAIALDGHLNNLCYSWGITAGDADFIHNLGKYHALLDTMHDVWINGRNHQLELAEHAEYARVGI